MNLRMYTCFLIFYLSTAVITVSGQRQMIDIKLLQAGDGGQCSPMEDREMVKQEIFEIVIKQSVQEIAASYSYTCNGTPGWRRVAFVNVTDTSYNCPTGLNLTSYSKRTCG